MLIVDANSMASIAFYTTNKMNFVNFVINAMNITQERDVVFTFDADGKYFRHSFYPEYKANRKHEDDGRNDFINAVKESLIETNHTVLQVPTFEADDVIATVSKNHPNCHILTKDRDIWQLITESTKVITHLGEVIDEATVVEKYGIKPRFLLDYKIMVGDTGDNIKGINKVGPKTALRLLEKYGTLMDIVNNLPYEPIALQNNFKNSNLLLLDRLVRLNQNVPLDNWEPTELNVRVLVNSIAKRI